VDFVVEGEAVIPIEVKHATMNRPRMPSELRAFIQSYHPPMGVVVTRDFTHEVELNGSRVLFIPACLIA
jgi:hypothetical protein